MLRDPSLTPEPWRGRRRLRVHPLLVVPVAAAVALALTLTRVLAHHASADWVVLGYATAAALASTACLPWHLPQRPVNDPRNHAITFGSRRQLGVLPLGLVLCGAVLVVHFELMRGGALPRSGGSGSPWSVSWWLALPVGLILLGVGLSLTRPAPSRQLTISPAGLVLRDGRRGFAVRWEQLRRLVPVLERRGHRVIELDAPGIQLRDRHGRPVAPKVRADLFDTDSVRLWLTLRHYHHHPLDRAEIGRAAGWRRRAAWRRVLPVRPLGPRRASQQPPGPAAP